MTPVKANKGQLDDSFDGLQSSFSDDSQSMDLYATRDKFQRWPILEVAVSICTVYKIKIVLISWKICVLSTIL